MSKPSGKKYDRTIHDKYDDQTVTTDVYRVLDAFEVKSQPRGHAIKKALCAGLRGKGDEFSDIVEAIDALIEDASMLLDKVGHAAVNEPKLERLLALRKAGQE